MRTKNSLRNVLVGIIAQLLMVTIGFVSRRVFIDTLGNEMLGINGLFLSIISMLSLTELGIGVAIICNLYKPLADNDEIKITALIQFFKKTYRIIVLIILCLGIILMPFLKNFLKEEINNIFLLIVFSLFLVDCAIPYFFAHKRSLIFADQKNYLITMVSSSSNILNSILQIVILIITKNYILYLSIKIIIRLLENIIISMIADKKYPFIKNDNKPILEKQTKDNIISNTKALSLHYVGNYLINGVDNIIISKFLGIVIVGFYSNYYLIITTLITFLSQFSTGILASFGNMVNKESREKSLGIFKKADFINFVIYNFSAISLLCLFNPFITLWINPDSLFSIPVVIMLSLNFYITGIAGVLGSIRASAGIFKPDRYVHLLMAVLNLIVSISLVQIIGIIGVFIGTLLCLLIKEISILPSIVYQNIFKISVKEYYKKLVTYCLTTVFAASITMYVCTFIITQGGWLFFLLRCGVCVIIPNIIIIILFRKTEEFIYMKTMIKNLITKRKILF
jgi:O-antigen/teichoic acid export membrane protein